MNKKVKSGLLALATAALFASQGALAAVSVGDQIKFADGPGGGNGGSFLITDYNSAGTVVKGSFYAFCVERDEYMNFSSFFRVDDISTEARDGGIAGGSPDPLDVKTAWLYTQYIESPSVLDAVAGWTAANAEVRGTAMQNAIWFIEQELTSVSGLASNLVTAATNAGWTNTGRVKILNVETLSGGWAQDQLYITPVPEPEIYAMMAAGLGLMGFVVRRRKQKDAIA